MTTGRREFMTGFRTLRKRFGYRPPDFNAQTHTGVAIGEYARINEGLVFWEKYGSAIHTVDASLVMPVLKSLGASIGPKWAWDGNAYQCRIGASAREIVLDMRDDESRVIEVSVFRLRGDDRDQKMQVGKISVPLPCEDWVPLQEQLRKVLR
jgi:hypothetical protein